MMHNLELLMLDTHLALFAQQCTRVYVRAYAVRVYRHKFAVGRPGPGDRSFIKWAYNIYQTF